MRKKIVHSILSTVLFGGGIGVIMGGGYSYMHPMKALEGYWGINHLLDSGNGKYHLFSRVNIMNRSIHSSTDVYDGDDKIKARCNIIFNICSVKYNTFCGKVLSFSLINSDDKNIGDFINTPYDVSYPIFYRLNDNTILIEQSQGHPVGSTRLLTRVTI